MRFRVVTTWLRRLALAIAALAVIIHGTGLVEWTARRMTDWGPDGPRSGILIVLGAEQHADGMIGMVSYWRCLYAARAWHSGRFDRVLVAGEVTREASGKTPREPRLGTAMSQALEAMGVPAEKIQVESASSNTHLNALYSARMLQGKRGPFTLVTSDYHTYRAARCFRKAGIAVECYPTPDVIRRGIEWSQRLSGAAILAEEAVKIVYYRWKGWI